MIQTLKKKLGGYPDHWPIYLAGQLRKDSPEGSLIPFEEEAQILRSQIPNPLYTGSIMQVGHGAIGGKVLDGNYHAQQAVQLAQEVLAGTPIGDVDPILEAKNQWMFDAQALKRAGIDMSNLPAENILINTKPSFYEEHTTLVRTLATLFSGGILTIIVLSYAISRQKIAERALREHERQLEQRVDERTEELSTTLEQLKQTQTQLIQTEKMSSLGQLVGGVAHELNNPLNFFSGNLDCLENYVQDLLALLKPKPALSIAIGSKSPRPQDDDIELDFIQHDIPKVLKSLREGASRIQKIVSSLQAFSRSDEQGSKLTDINHSIESTLDVLKLQISEGIDVQTDYGNIPQIICNPGEINQVFLSIIVNAIEAMQAEGSPIKQVSICTAVHSDDEIRIIIQNTGPGIPDAIQAKVFDPFFTTKPIGQGTGLGLAIAYQTVQKHHGTIQIHSEGKTGTTVTIDLPTALPKPEQTRN